MFTEAVVIVGGDIVPSVAVTVAVANGFPVTSAKFPAIYETLGVVSVVAV